MHYAVRWFCLVCVLVLIPAWCRAEEAVFSRIAFGSCCKQEKPAPIFESVAALKPQLFLFLGDNIYADTLDMDVMRAKYAKLGAQSSFQKLQATCPLLATWDDHDYGNNDAGAEYPKKSESQQQFLDFWGVPANSPLRTQAGVYSAHVFGPPGQRVQVILLDTRYFRSPLKPGYTKGELGEGRRGDYTPNTSDDATVLGETQWKWLAEQLRQPANVRLIGTSIQFIAHEHGYEHWGNFPRERSRLLQVLRDTQAHGVVLLSGDRHSAEISRLPANDPQGPGYALHDVTSSSLNQPLFNFTGNGRKFENEINSHRVGLTYFDVNFGLVDIDWAPSDPVLRLQLRDATGEVVVQERLALSSLQPKE